MNVLCTINKQDLYVALSWANICNLACGRVCVYARSLLFH